MGIGGHVQLVDVGMEYAVYEAYAGALIGILVGELDVDLPGAALEGCYFCQLEACYVACKAAYSLLVP